MANDRNFWALALAADPTNSRVLYMAESAILRSADAGESWSFVSGDPESAGVGIRALIVTKGGFGLADGLTPVHRTTTDGLDWVIHGQEVALIHTLEIHPPGSETIWGGASAGVTRLVAPSTEWATVGALLPGAVHALESHQGRLLAGVTVDDVDELGVPIGNHAEVYEWDPTGDEFRSLLVRTDTRGVLSFAAVDNQLFIGTDGDGVLCFGL
ncbi:MAG: hypothetical protein MJB57_02465 [Gemmatimonadetes bacterium]|nr:hypothetical protein [Gemmatimonadota bacterium]